MQAFLVKTVDFFTLSERGYAHNALGYKIKIVVTRAESCENQQEKERRGYFKGQSQCSSVSNSHLQWYLDSSESFNGDNTDPPFRLLGQLRTLFRAMINFLCLGLGRSQKVGIENTGKKGRWYRCWHHLLMYHLLRSIQHHLHHHTAHCSRTLLLALPSARFSPLCLVREGRDGQKMESKKACPGLSHSLEPQGCK